MAKLGIEKNSAATKERIFQAASLEFAAYGIAGGRVDRIATAANCNKNLIYVYFGSKEDLFKAVLGRHLARVYEEIVLDPNDLGAYACKVFDFAVSNPELMRLMAWSNLELSSETRSDRRSSSESKLELLRKARKAEQPPPIFSPGFLLTASMALATAWSPLSPFGSLIDPDATKRPARLRDQICEAVRLLTEAGPGRDAKQK